LGSLVKTYFRSFAGGELTPELFGRIDDVKFQTGLAIAQNFVTLPHGPARARPGTHYIAKPKTFGSRMIHFTEGPGQQIVVVLGNQCARFVRNGAVIRVVDGPTPPNYKPNRAFGSADVNPATDVFTTTLVHNLATGDPIRITVDSGTAVVLDDGTLAGRPLDPSVVFYAIVLTTNTYKIAYTLADALAGTPVPVLNAGAGSFRLNYAYQTGDLVNGVTAGAPGIHYCTADPTVNGAPQITPGTPSRWYLQPSSGELEVPMPYLTAQLGAVRYFQSNDVMTLLHVSHPPAELRRFSLTRWAYVTVSFAPVLASPTGFAGAATEGGMAATVVSVGTAPTVNTASKLSWITGESIYGSITVNGTLYGPGFFRVGTVNNAAFDLLDTAGVPISFGVNPASGTFRAVPLSSLTSNTYRVTAVDVDGRESQPSPEVTIANNLFAEGAFNTLTWFPVPGAVRYNVYRKQGNVYGLIGTPEATTLKDDNIDATFDESIPYFDSSLSSAPFPTAGCYHEQRRVFGRVQTIWMTRTGTEADLTFTLPVRDDDRIEHPIASTEYSEIQHLLSLGDLIALTNSAEYVVAPTDSAVMTPGSTMSRPQSFIGANQARPVIVNDTVVYSAARGGHVFAFRYQAAQQGFKATDLSLRAVHLFDGFDVTEITMSKSPYPIVWGKSTAGNVVAVTMVPDQEVLGWHRHTFGGTVVSLCAATEGAEDRLYVIVERTVNGVVEQHIERMSPFRVAPIADAVQVDGAVTLTNVSAGVVTVGPHLAGATVSVLADGVVLPQQTVSTAGTIFLPPTLKPTFAKVTVGRPIDAVMQTLPLAMQVDGFAQGNEKAIGNVWVRVANSGPFFAGPMPSELVPSDPADPAVRGLPVATTLRTEKIKARTKGAWTPDGQLLLKHSLPLPLTVVGLTLEVDLGD
jgi:hypothetical protein